VHLPALRDNARIVHGKKVEEHRMKPSDRARTGDPNHPLRRRDLLRLAAAGSVAAVLAACGGGTATAPAQPTRAATVAGGATAPAATSAPAAATTAPA